MAESILEEFETHRKLLDHQVNIDFVFAYADRDEKTNEPVNNALTLHGYPALAIARIVNLKDRVMGRGDAEICLDADHWEKITEPDQRALLDHELHHLEVKEDKRGIILDDLERPMLKMRKHDRQFGWFDVIAQRHGLASVERQQARTIMDTGGQYYWPEMCNIAVGNGATKPAGNVAPGKVGEVRKLGGNTVTISSGGHSVTMTEKQFHLAANKAKKKK